MLSVIVRRALAVLLAATMLHLTVAAADAACAEPGTMGHHGAVAAESHGTMAMPHAPPCNTPVQPSCCAMSMGCTMAATVAERKPMCSEPAVGARIELSSADAPRLRRAAPEPPPPKS